MSTAENLVSQEYKYGFVTDIESDTIPRGLSEELNKAGLVQSQRGIKGGYHLARPASEIHLNQVIRVLDGERVDSHCKSYAGVLDACVHTGDCGIRPVIVELHQIVDNALSEITLSQLLDTEANVDATLHHIQITKQRTQQRA